MHKEAGENVTTWYRRPLPSFLPPHVPTYTRSGVHAGCPCLGYLGNPRHLHFTFYLCLWRLFIVFSVLALKCRILTLYNFLTVNTLVALSYTCTCAGRANTMMGLRRWLILGILECWRGDRYDSGCNSHHCMHYQHSLLPSPGSSLFHTSDNHWHYRHCHCYCAY